MDDITRKINASQQAINHFQNTFHQTDQQGKGSLERNANSRQLLCSYCSREFDDKTRLTDHITNHLKLQEKYSSFFYSSSTTHKLQFPAIQHDQSAEPRKSCVDSLPNDPLTEEYDLEKQIVCHQIPKQYSCSYCSSSFANEYLLQKHGRYHIHKKSYSCSHCDQSVTRKSKLKRQIILGVEKKLFSFPSCSRSSPQEVVKTPENHAARKLFPCPHCGRSFSQRERLNRHIEIHLQGKPFSCPNVHSRLFIRESQLKNQTNTHKKPFSYSTWYRTVTRSGNLKIHNSKHVIENQITSYPREDFFLCHICNRSFCYKRSFYRHLASHTEGNRYSCHFCEQSFETKHNLEVHIMTHMDETPTSESSETTDESSSSSRLFENNLRFKPANLSPTNEEPVTSSTEVSYIHTEDESPLPPRSRLFEHKQSFNSRNSVSAKSCMTGSFSVETCTVKSVLTEAWRSADDVQMHSCPCCGRSFEARAYFLKQIDVHGKGNFQMCLFCKKSFASIQLLSKHLGKHHRPFFCSSCTISFANEIILNKHISDFPNEKHFTYCTYCNNLCINSSNLEMMGT